MLTDHCSSKFLKYTWYSILPAGHAAPLCNSITPQVKAHSHNGARQEHSTHHKQADQQVQEGIKYGAVENQAKVQKGSRPAFERRQIRILIDMFCDLSKNRKHTYSQWCISLVLLCCHHILTHTINNTEQLHID